MLTLHIMGRRLMKLLFMGNDFTPRFNEVERGVNWYHLVCLSVCGQNRVRSVSSTILIGSISYFHILSSNFRKCVGCNARFKIQKIWNFGDFFKFVTLTLSSFDLFLVSFLRCHCRLQFRMDSFHIWYKWSIAWEGVSHVMTFDLDLYLQGHSALT